MAHNGRDCDLGTHSNRGRVDEMCSEFLGSRRAIGRAYRRQYMIDHWLDAEKSILARNEKRRQARLEKKSG